MKYILIISSVVFLSACAPVDNVKVTDNTNPSLITVSSGVKPAESDIPLVPKNLPETSPEKKEELIQETIPKKIKELNLTDSKDGITVEVSDIQKAGENTIITLVIDNHIYNIYEMNIAGLSSLNGTKATDYQILETQMGGHHIKATITFPVLPAGPLIIGLEQDLSFNFDLI